MTTIGNAGADLASLYRSMPGGGTLAVSKQDEVNAQDFTGQLNAGSGTGGLGGATGARDEIHLSAQVGEQALKSKERTASIEARYLELASEATSPASEESSASGVTQAKSLEDLTPLKLFNREDVDNYNEKLLDKLSSLGVDTSQPIDFGFSHDGSVVVNNDHPDKELIEKTFSEDMDLRNGLVKTSQFFLFQELSSLSEQWASKVEAGVSEEVAGQWLVNASKSATRNSGQGLRFSEGAAQDPFARSASQSVASRAYAS